MSSNIDRGGHEITGDSQARDNIKLSEKLTERLNSFLRDSDESEKVNAIINEEFFRDLSSSSDKEAAKRWFEEFFIKQFSPKMAAMIRKEFREADDYVAKLLQIRELFARRKEARETLSERVSTVTTDANPQARLTDPPVTRRPMVPSSSPLTSGRREPSTGPTREAPELDVPSSTVPSTDQRRQMLDPNFFKNYSNNVSAHFPSESFLVVTKPNKSNPDTISITLKERATKPAVVIKNTMDGMKAVFDDNMETIKKTFPHVLETIKATGGVKDLMVKGENQSIIEYMCKTMMAAGFKPHLSDTARRTLESASPPSTVLQEIKAQEISERRRLGNTST